MPSHPTLQALRDLIAAHSPHANTSSESVLATLGTPSLSIALLHPSGTISTDCISTLGDTPTTAFQACSISKPVAGMALMRLAAQGKLELDAPAAKYLPTDVVATMQDTPFATPATREMALRVTVAQLMSHTAGFNVGGFPGYSADIDAKLMPDIRTILAGRPPANTLHVGAQSLPGYEYSYSGGGITVLQIVLESVTRKPFAEAVQDLVLTPLGMQRSFYGRPRDGEDFARSYRNGEMLCEPAYHLFGEDAAAGLWTTPGDLLKVVRAVQRSLRSEEEEEGFLPKDLARRMVTEVSGGYGLTWRAPREPGVAFFHAGNNLPGWHCWVMGYADVAGTGDDGEKRNVKGDGDGICIMTNSDLGHATMHKVAQAVMYLEGWEAVQRWDGRSAGVQTAFAVSEKTMDETWKAWQGRWGKEGEFELFEGEEGGQPCLRFKDLPAVRLKQGAKPQDGAEERIWLVLEGLEMMLCLMEKDGKKMIEVWNEGPSGVDMLERKG